MPRNRSLAACLSLALPFLSPAVTLAADAPPADARLEAARKVRASIPEPVEQPEGKKGLDFAYEGDLVVAGENAGSVSVSVDVGTFRDQPVWLVLESVEDAWAGSKRRTEASYWLARDLSLLRGEWTRSSDDGSVRLEFRREGEAFVVKKETVKGDGDPVHSQVLVKAPADATYGRGALLLLLRYAPGKPETYAVPMVQLETAMPQIDEHEPRLDPAPAAIEVKGPAKWGSKPDVVDSWLVQVRRSSRSQNLHLDPKSRALIGIEQVGTDVKIVPKGKGGERVAYEDDQPAKSWKAAFLKFGHGYHMAVEKWIDGAIDWPAVHAHDVATGSCDKSLSVEDLRKAYVAEFLRMSKHRTRENADDLLRMTLATGEKKTLPDETVVLATHPEFGGNIFHFRAKDGVWKIVQIDQ